MADDQRTTYEYRAIIAPGAVQLVELLNDAGAAGGWLAFAAYPVSTGPNTVDWCALCRREKR
jgi:hypothetical protein